MSIKHKVILAAWSLIVIVISGGGGVFIKRHSKKVIVVLIPPVIILFFASTVPKRKNPNKGHERTHIYFGIIPFIFPFMDHSNSNHWSVIYMA